MKKRVSVVVCLVLIVVIAAGASEVKWTGGGADELWTTGANWDGGTVPGTYDAIVLNPPPQRGPVINSDIECGEMRMPLQVKLGWETAKTATAHTVYISDKLDDVKNGVKPISKG